MSDHYVKVKVQLEQMKSFGEDAVVKKQQDVDADAEQEVVVVQEVPVSSSPLAPQNITITGRDASNTSITSKHRGKSRGKPGRDGKHISDSVSAHIGKNLNRMGHEKTLHIRGTGKILQGKTESNGNYVTLHSSKNMQETRDGFKHGKKRRPVTVDTSKAKTSLEALKLSIKQLQWKEVC